MKSRRMNERIISTCSSVVGNQPGVTKRYLIDRGTTISIETIELNTVSNEEMLRLLELAGKPSFLGTIDGELRVFPATMNQERH